MNTPGTFIGYLSLKSELVKFMPMLGFRRVGARLCVFVFLKRVNISVAYVRVCMWCTGGAL